MATKIFLVILWTLAFLLAGAFGHALAKSNPADQPPGWTTTLTPLLPWLYGSVGLFFALFGRLPGTRRDVVPLVRKSLANAEDSRSRAVLAALCRRHAFFLDATVKAAVNNALADVDSPDPIARIEQLLDSLSEGCKWRGSRGAQSAAVSMAQSLCRGKVPQAREPVALALLSILPSVEDPVSLEQFRQFLASYTQNILHSGKHAPLTSVLSALCRKHTRYWDAVVKAALISAAENPRLPEAESFLERVSDGRDWRATLGAQDALKCLGETALNHQRNRMWHRIPDIVTVISKLPPVSDPRVLALLITCVGSDSYGEGPPALRALSKVPDWPKMPSAKTLLPALLSKLDDSRHTEHALNALTAIGGPDTVAALCRSLEWGRHLSQIRNSLDTLAPDWRFSAAAREVEQYVLNQLQSEVPETRAHAAQILETIALPNLVQPLLNRLACEKDARAFCSLVNALGATRDPRAIEPLLRAANQGGLFLDHVDVILNALDKINPQWRETARIREFVRQLCSDDDQGSFANGCQYLAVINTPEAFARLSAFVDSPDPLKREHALSALRLCPSEVSLGLLISRLTDTSPKVRTVAGIGVTDYARDFKLSSPMRQRLLDACAAGLVDSKIQYSAAAVLTAMDDFRVLPWLVKQLERSDELHSRVKEACYETVRCNVQEYLDDSWEKTVTAINRILSTNQARGPSSFNREALLRLAAMGPFYYDTITVVSKACEDDYDSLRITRRISPIWKKLKSQVDDLLRNNN